MAGSIAASPDDYLTQLARTAAAVDRASVEAYANALFDAWTRRAQVFVFGNGGSAYNASHHVTDYVKTASAPRRPRLMAYSLADNYGLTTAIANDLSYDETFSFPLESYARTGDIAVGISCSGNSPNLLRACRWARDHGLTVVALTGFKGGQVRDLAHIHINVPSENYGVIEDLHLSIGHIATQMLHVRVLAKGVA
jgi:phosphoheptose isomerase